MPDSQRYPLKSCLIKYDLDIDVFVSFIRGFSVKGTWTFLDQIKVSSVSVVNRPLPSLYGESLENCL